MKIIAAVVGLFIASPAMAETALKPPLADIGFLVGRWQSDDGQVADTGETSKGESLITIEADGGALLRRDKTTTFDKNGESSSSFAQLMMIYREGDAVKAIYEDGEGHLIRYDSVTVTPGKAVTFNSAPGAGPVFRLTYEAKAPDVLAVTFGMIAPGSADLHLIASGTLRRAK
ncbi:MAG TPA: hypothetical protein VNH64_06400 [Parvularculaceae bacterium]|nr:hypothetical protein [Parvularculaceae bacterium]